MSNWVGVKHLPANISYFHPYLGKMNPFWLIYFQLGWNHQVSHWFSAMALVAITPLKNDRICLVKLARDLTRPHPKRWFSKGNPLISGKSGLVNYYNLARFVHLVVTFEFSPSRCDGTKKTTTPSVFSALPMIALNDGVWGQGKQRSHFKMPKRQRKQHIEQGLYYPVREGLQ